MSLSVEVHAQEDADARIDDDLTELDAVLDDVEQGTRRYFYSWLATGVGLAGGQAYIAATSDSRPIRGSYWIGTGLAGASLVLQLISPAPALFGVGRYRKLPANSLEEKRYKREYGGRVLAGQAQADMRAVSATQHITGVVAAVGSGLAVALAWDNSLKQAITRSLGVFVVAELQIITRPRTAIEAHDARQRRSFQFAVAPMIAPYAQGLMLAGTF